MDRRSRALWIGAGLVLVAVALLLVLLDRGHDRHDSAPPARIPGSAGSGPGPRPIPTAASGAQTAADAAVTPMPEGLEQDLAMFNSDQLRAELESISLSYPAVAVVIVTCDVRPCTAEVQVVREDGDADDEVEALNTFLDMVSKRFQGYLTATFHEVVTGADGRAIRAVLVVGGTAPLPAPHYP